MARLPKLSGNEVIKALAKDGFGISRHKGSHVVVVKQLPDGKKGTVVPLHPELKLGTLKAILKQLGISEERFLELL